MVFVDGIVDGNVHQPTVFILIQIEDVGLVLVSWWDSVCWIAIASIISRLNPGIGLKTLVVEATDIIEVKTYPLVCIFVEVGVKGWGNAQ